MSCAYISDYTLDMTPSIILKAGGEGNDATALPMSTRFPATANRRCAVVFTGPMQDRFDLRSGIR